MLTSKILRIFPLFRRTAAWRSRWNHLKPCEDPQETGFSWKRSRKHGFRIVYMEEGSHMIRGEETHGIHHEDI